MAAIDTCRLAPGDIVGRYKVVRKLGSGVVGAVFEVADREYGTHCALRAFPLPDDSSGNRLRTEILAEGHALVRLQHQNIARVLDVTFDVAARTPCLVTELALGEDGQLHTLADLSGPDELKVCEWFSSLASALDYLHSNGIVHGDVKLENVLVTAGMQVKLTNFGVSRLLPGHDRDLDATADAYLLGDLLVRLLDGSWYDGDPATIDRICKKCRFDWSPVLCALFAPPSSRPTSLAPLVARFEKDSGWKAMRRPSATTNRAQASTRLVRRAKTDAASRMSQVRMDDSVSVWDRYRRGLMLGAVCVCAAVAAWSGHRFIQQRENAERARVEELRREICESGEKARALRQDHDGQETKARGLLKTSGDELARIWSGLGGLLRTAEDDPSLVDVKSNLVHLIVRMGQCREKLESEVSNGVTVVRQCEASLRARPVDESMTEQDLGKALGAYRAVEREIETVRGYLKTCSDDLERNLSQARADYEVSKSRLDKLIESKASALQVRGEALAKIRSAENDEALSLRAEFASAVDAFVRADGLVRGNGDYTSALKEYRDAVLGLEAARADETLRKGACEEAAEKDDGFAVGLCERGTFDETLRRAKDYRESRTNHTEYAEAVALKYALIHRYYKYVQGLVPSRRRSPRTGAAFSCKTGPKEIVMTSTTGPGQWRMTWVELLGHKSNSRNLIDLVEAEIPPATPDYADIMLGRWLSNGVFCPAVNRKDGAVDLLRQAMEGGGDSALARARMVLPTVFDPGGSKSVKPEGLTSVIETPPTPAFDNTAVLQACFCEDEDFVLMRNGTLLGKLRFRPAGEGAVLSTESGSLVKLPWTEFRPSVRLSQKSSAEAAVGLERGVFAYFIPAEGKRTAVVVFRSHFQGVPGGKRMVHVGCRFYGD